MTHGDTLGLGIMALTVVSSIALCHLLRWIVHKLKRPNVQGVKRLAASARVLLHLGRVAIDRDLACQHMLITGASGSGKTSAVGKLVLLSHLYDGSSMLFLPVKTTDVGFLTKLAERAGRVNDLVLIEPSKTGDPTLLWNPLAWYQHHPHMVAATENIVRLIATLSEIGQQGSADNDEAIWAHGRDRLCAELVTLHNLAEEQLSFQSMMLCLSELPDEPGQALTEAFRGKYLGRLLYRMAQRFDDMTTSQQHEANRVAEYFDVSFPSIAEKTRSIFRAMLENVLAPWCRPPFLELCNGDTTVSPETVLEQGKIVIPCLPVHTYGIAGQMYLSAWKRALQEASLARRYEQGERVTLLYSDEAQMLLHESDVGFAATVRSAGISLCYLTRTYEQIAYSMGGPQGDELASAFCSNMAVKVFCRNDGRTAQFAESLLGRERSLYASGGVSGYGSGQPGSLSGNFSEQMESVLNARLINQLRTGGPRHGHVVDAVVQYAGEFEVVEFSQSV